MRQPSNDGAVAKRSTRVRLRPHADWHKRNFLTSVLIPSLFVKRADRPAVPQFPKVREGEICITWIGHASFLVQTHEVNILIDPIWSKWLKVIKRLKQPGFEIHHLPAIDFVLVTHAHFDHLDRRTLRRVAANQPIVVPMGVGNLVHDLGFHIVHELDYWQTIELGPLKISLTPCHHWGARFLADLHRDFGGFVIASNGARSFTVASALTFLASINRRATTTSRSPSSTAHTKSPAGPKSNDSRGSSEGISRGEGAETLIPMHYGTFRLGFEPLHEPPQRLLAAARTQGVEQKILVMTEGKPIVL